MQRHRSPTISEAEKTAITVACQRFIDEFLKPRFLPVIRPTEFNYPIDVHSSPAAGFCSVAATGSALA